MKNRKYANKIEGLSKTTTQVLGGHVMIAVYAAIKGGYVTVYRRIMNHDFIPFSSTIQILTIQFALGVYLPVLGN